MHSMILIVLLMVKDNQVNPKNNLRCSGLRTRRENSMRFRIKAQLMTVNGKKKKR